MKKICSLIFCLLLLIGLLPMTAFAATTIDSADIMITHPAHLDNPETFLQVYGNCQVDTTYRSDGFQNGLRWREIATGKNMGASDTFVGGKQYELSVMLIAKTGYAFSASATAVTVNMDPASLTVSDVNHAKATITLTADKLYIHHVTITGLDAPKAGSTPDFSVSVQEDTCELAPNSPEFATNNGVAWYDQNEEKMATGDKFQAGKQYQAVVLLQAKAGYEFPQSAQVTINGKNCKTEHIFSDIIAAVLEYPALADEHTHVYDTEWSYNFGQHYKHCEGCDEIFFVEGHKGGQPTCEDAGVCSVCGYAYIEASEKYHVPDTSKWVARIDMYHFHPCSICGAHCDVEDHRWSPKYHSVGAEGHAWQCADCKGYDVVQPHNPGPEATDTTPQTCKDCGYVITPAKNHKHNLTLVPEVAPTCEEPGSCAYYVCDGCDVWFSDSEGKHPFEEGEEYMIAPLGHKVSNDFAYNDSNHWRVCTTCGAKLTETEMAHELEDGACTSCKFGSSVPDATDPGKTSEPEAGMPWWVLLIVGFAAVGAGIGIGVGVLVMSKKKKE